MKYTLLFAGAFFAMNGNAQCANTANIYSFQYNGSTYEVVKENKSWVDAAACAVERGGILAEINDQQEQEAVYSEALNSAGINPNNTVAPDGGGASYLWIGGTDRTAEGEWLWDGDNDGTGSQFWQGLSNGNPVGGLYNNWGNEPDDFGQGQDGLGLAITNWPLGTSGQWNDVNDGNSLYFIIEIDGSASLNELQGATNHVTLEREGNNIQVIIDNDMQAADIRILDAMGKTIRTSASQTIDISNLPAGSFFVQVQLENGAIEMVRFNK